MAGPISIADLLPVASNPRNLTLQRGQCLVLFGLDLVADLDGYFPFEIEMTFT